jgi:hypothetical protein
LPWRQTRWSVRVSMPTSGTEQAVGDQSRVEAIELPSRGR